MAIRFIDGFDHLDGASGSPKRYMKYVLFDPFWTEAGCSTASDFGRYAGDWSDARRDQIYCQRNTGYEIAEYYRTFSPALTNIVVGFDWQVQHPSFYGDSEFFQARMGIDGKQFALSVSDPTEDDEHALWTGGSHLKFTGSKAAVAALIPNQTWVHLEVEAAGGLKVYKEGALWMSGGASGAVNQVGLFWENYGFAGYRTDNLYVLDDSGGVNTARLGKCRVLTYYPVSDVAPNEFAGIGNSYGAGHAGYVRENRTTFPLTVWPDEDAGYLKATAHDVAEVFKLETFEVFPVQIHGLALNVCAKAVNVSGSAAVKPFVRIAGIEYYGSEHVFAVDDTYVCIQQIWDRNPATGEEWNYATVAGADWGFLYSSGSGEIRVTQVAVELLCPLEATAGLGGRYEVR